MQIIIGNSIGVNRTSTLGGDPFEYTAIDNNFSMEFDGTEDLVVATPTGLGITDAITISAWVKTPINWNGGPNPRIGTVVSEELGWQLRFRGGGIDTFGIVIYNTDGSVNVLYSSVLGANDGNWHHIVATYDGTSNTDALKVYVDNVVTKGTTLSTGIQNLNKPTTIGAFTYNAPIGTIHFFQENIDEVAVWNTVLSEETIEAIYNTTNDNPGKAADLTETPEGVPVAWYRMGD